MKHRYCLASPHSSLHRWNSLNLLNAFAVVVLTVAFASSASAQRLASLNPAIKSAVDAKPHAEEIKAFVKSQVDALKNDKEPVQQQRGRDALAKESGAGGIAPSPSYLDVYATAVNEQLLPLASDKTSVRTRLNAAIALQKVARGTNSAKLAPAATKFAQDPCVAVTLWAIKASQPIVLALAPGGKPDKLTGAVVDAAKKNADNGDLVEEAYKALVFDQRLVNEQSAAVVTGDLLKLFQSRIDQYATTTPTRPELERYGVNFLTASRLWDTKEGKKQRGAIMQQLSNQISLVGEHAAARAEPERKDYVDRLKNLGEALSALSGRPDVNDPKLGTAGKALSDIQNSIGGQELNDRAAAAQAAIKAKFPDVKPAPKMSDTAVKEPEVEVVEDPDDADEAAQPAAGGDGAKDGAPKDAAPKEAPVKKEGAAPPQRPAPKAPPAREPAPPAEPAPSAKPPAQDRSRLQ